MKAGYGREDITPNLGVELCGYGYDLKRQAESVQDNLYASCIAFENKNQFYLIINCDLIGFDEKILNIIKNKIKLKFGIDETCVMILATHTHEGPAVKNYLGCGEIDDEYLNGLPEKILAAVEKAMLNLSEIDCVLSSQKQIEPISFNRAIPDGPVDNYVRGFVIKRVSASDIAVASYNCHPVVMGVSKAISRDYPGQVADALSKTGINGMFITGICGDINPIQRGTPEILKNYGEKLADEFISGINNNKKFPESFSHAIIKSEVPVQQFNADKVRQTAADIINSGENSGFKRVVKEWEKSILNILESKNLEYLKHEEGIAHVFLICDIMIVGINYEAFTDIGTDIRKAFPDKIIIVAGNSDDVRGYFPTKEVVGNKNDYAAFSSSFLYQKLPVTENAAEIFAESVISGIKKYIKI